MNLVVVCNRLHEFDGEHTIYAKDPWTPASEAIVAPEPEEGGLPPAARESGMTYFIEVFVAREFIADWHASLPAPPTPEATVKRLIAYATHDA